MPKPARLAGIPGMLDRRIAAAQIGGAAAALIAIWATDSWTVPAWAAAGLLVLQGFQRQHRTWFQRELLRVANEVWAQEYQARLQVELARGLTDTQARFLVGGVMARCDFTRYGPPQIYFAAHAFLRSRGVVVGKTRRSTSCHVARR